MASEGMPLNATFEASRARLAAVLEEASAVPELAADALDAWRVKFAQHAFHLVVAGEFKRGKSTLINALIGADLLPTGVIPLTSIVTIVQHGESAAASLVFDDGTRRDVPLAALVEFVTERGNPGNDKHVREVRVGVPTAWLEGGIRLVDTPGVGSVHSHNSELTSRYLPTADAVILVVSADQPLGRNELDFLGEIRRHAGKVFCLLNKVDHLSSDERIESLAFTAGVLREAVGAKVPLFAVSARQALRARSDGDAQGWIDSGLAAFDQALQDFLQREGGDLWLHSMQRQLLRLLAESRFALELEQQALVSPLLVLEEKLQVFAQQRLQMLQAASDLDPLLDAESRKLVRERVEPDLRAFTRALLPRLLAALDDEYHHRRSSAAAVLQVQLEKQLVEEVRGAFDAWRMAESVLVNKAFEYQCQRFWRGMHEAVDDLMRCASELFAVPFTAIATDTLWRVSSTFNYKFWDEPSTLQLAGRGLLRLLPGMFSRPLILRRSRRRAADLVDMQSGRLRHDFEEHVRQAARDFRREMLERIGATVAGIEAAIEKGRAAKSRDEGKLALRTAELRQALARIRALESRLTDDSGGS